MRRSASRRARPALAAPTIALLLLIAAAAASPGASFAATAGQVEARVLQLVNAARVDRGLAPLKLRADLVDFAGDRAAKMASTGVLKHPSCLPCMFERRGISYSNYGETIAVTWKPWVRKAARDLFEIWRHSPPHWSILMSAKLKFIGIGVAPRGDVKTYAAAVLTN